MLIIGSACIGLGYSAWAGQIGMLITRYFGLRSAGAIVGITFAIPSFFIGAGPVVLGFIRVSYGNYAPALFACTAIQSLAFVFVSLLGRFTEFAPDADGLPVGDPLMPAAADQPSSAMAGREP